MRFLFLILFLFFSTFAFSQIVNLDATTHNTTQTGCFYWFYDEGGVMGDYTSNKDYHITFKSNNAVTTHIRIAFSDFDIDPSDTLFIYDGPTISSPLIGKYNNNLNPLTGASSVVQASITNTTGELTVRFKTNAINQKKGWVTAIACIHQCQKIEPKPDSALMVPFPDDSTYISACDKQLIVFAAKGHGADVFKENDIIYHQDSTNCMYIWDFGDGIMDTGRVVTHQYAYPNAYDVALTVVDTFTCQYSAIFKTRISYSPLKAINSLPDLCIGNSFNLTTSHKNNANIVLQNASSKQTENVSYNTKTFIPDGPNCESTLGLCYYTPITFTQFPPNAIINSASDIASICINMEHSFVGDLSFRIICPSGASVVLDPYVQSGGAFLGVPIDESLGCDPNTYANRSGTGWTYCWSEIYPTHGKLQALGVTYNMGAETTIPATDLVTNTKYLQPEAPFSGLAGCPLNGEWKIEICDNWEYDNGWIFSWDLTLTDQAQTTGWGYSVGIDSITWSGPNINKLNDSTAIVSPQTAVTHQYTATAWDQYGCTYDTTFKIKVLDYPNTNLGLDTSLCKGQALALDADTAMKYTWSNGANTKIINVTNSGTYQVTASNYTSKIICAKSDTINVTFLEGTIVDLGKDTAVCNGVSLQLDAGSNGIDYKWSTGDTTQHILVDTSGNYWVTYHNSEAASCPGSDTIIVDFVSYPNLDLGNDINNCGDSEITLNAGNIGSNYSYLWSTGDTTKQIVVNSTGNYAVIVSNHSAISSTYCSKTDTIKVVITPLPIVNLGEDICESSSIMLDAKNEGQIFKWSNGDVSQITNISSSGTYAVTVSDNLNTSCKSSDTIVVKIIPTPIFNFEKDIKICSHESILIDVQQAANGYTYLWSDGGTSPILEKNDLPIGLNKFAITITGCKPISDTLLINVIVCDLQMSNVVTPNGDGFNDIFKVDGVENYPNSTLTIFNRWGKKIYENNDYKNDWNGDNYPAGTYYYILHLNFGKGNIKQLQGTITIVRD